MKVENGLRDWNTILFAVLLIDMDIYHYSDLFIKLVELPIKFRNGFCCLDQLVH